MGYKISYLKVTPLGGDISGGGAKISSLPIGQLLRTGAMFVVLTV